MTARLLRADALSIPLRDRSVNLVVTSPPYFALRDYEEGGESLRGQIGSEARPRDFLVALWRVMDELWRVMADDGIVVVNLGDKRSGSGGHNNATLPGRRRGRAGEGAQAPRRHAGPGPSSHGRPRLAAAARARSRVMSIAVAPPRFPWAEFEAILPRAWWTTDDGQTLDGPNMVALARHLGVSRDSLHRWKRDGFTVTGADRAAITFGRHPAELWAAWIDEPAGEDDR
jgi:hypothetical protein